MVQIFERGVSIIVGVDDFYTKRCKHTKLAEVRSSQVHALCDAVPFNAAVSAGGN